MDPLFPASTSSSYNSTILKRYIEIPPEIIHHILLQLRTLGYSHQCTAALQSCALVSRMFLDISHPILFRHTTVSTASTKSFLNLLQSNPNIVSYVHHLRFRISHNGSSELFPKIIDLVRQTLRELTVVEPNGYLMGGYYNSVEMHPCLTKGIQYILQEGDLEKFTLQRMDFPSMNSLQELFRYGTSMDEDMEFIPERSAISHPVNMSRRVKPEALVIPLSIWRGWKALVNWLIDPRCAIDLSALKELRLICSTIEDMAYFAPYCEAINLGTTVERLKLEIRQTEDSLVNVTLAPFSSLRSFEIHCDSFRGKDHIAILPHLLSTLSSDNRIETIILSWELDVGDNDSFLSLSPHTLHESDQTWNIVDDILCSQKFLTLQWLKLKVSYWSCISNWFVRTQEDLEHVISRHLPGCSDKGIVEIEVAELRAYCGPITAPINSKCYVCSRQTKSWT
ncbi:hypothetical protein BDQ17DRAFT_1369520 [Cyathus striatus]|nr:hypothetical protein BDQ17DRAFT_1369520 [Cyathus striatus]